MSRLARPTVSVVLALVAGCGSSHAPEEVTTFFVNDLVIPIPDTPTSDEAWPTAGIDLDGVDSDGSDESTCTGRARDGVSLHDPTERGIDNMMGWLWGNTAVHRPRAWGPTATELVGSGELRVALKVSGVESYEDDGEVEVQLGTARVPGCDEAAPETCGPVLDGDMLARAGQPMVFEPVGSPRRMRIVAGRLQGELGDLRVVAALLTDFEPESAVLPVTVRDVRIDAAIDAGGLDGSLGGGLSYADLLELVFAMDPSTPVEEYERLYDLFGDLEPSPSDPLSCDALSLGIRLGAVHVTPVDS